MSLLSNYGVRASGAVAMIAPTINFGLKSDVLIRVTFTNNITETARIYYSITDSNPSTTFVDVAAGATSSAIDFTGLTGSTSYTIYAKAEVGTEVSTIASFTTTTNAPTQLILYSNGNEHTNITGGWTYVPSTCCATFTKNATNMTIRSPYWTDGRLRTVNNVNKTGFGRLQITWSINGLVSWTQWTLLVTSPSIEIIGGGSSTVIRIPSPSIMNISSAANTTNFEMYIANTGTATITITDIRLLI
jgi:hypothetical protein